MIFVTVGSQKFQFDRLVRAVDAQVGDGRIREEVFAQTGACNYLPVNFPYKKFIDWDEFDALLGKADIIISHGGTGTIMRAIKKGKKVIAVPRSPDYGEHVDDHQTQITTVLGNKNLAFECRDCELIWKAVEEIKTHVFDSYEGSGERIIKNIASFIG